MTSMQHPHLGLHVESKLFSLPRHMAIAQRKDVPILELIFERVCKVMTRGSSLDTDTQHEAFDDILTGTPKQSSMEISDFPIDRYSICSRSDFHI